MQESPQSTRKFRLIPAGLTKQQMLSFLVFPISIIYMELIVKYCTVNSFFNIGLVFMPLFSLAAGVLLGAICTCFSERTNQILARIILFALAILFSVQTVYHWCFDKYLILYSVGAGGAGQIIEAGIWETTLRTIKACAVPIFLLFAPAVLSCFFVSRKRGVCFPKLNWRSSIATGATAFVLHFVTLLLILTVPTSNELYKQFFDPNLTVGTFGLMSSELMDLQYNILGIQSASAIDPETSSELPASTTTSSQLPWVMNFDFNKLAAGEQDEDIKSIHEYFANRKPTNRNAYTGMFEGYNLIYITAEGFSPYVIDAQLTPTLYKMYNKGFKFNNYYVPIWGVSTSDGEYANCTGLIPKSGAWSFYESGKQGNNMAFTMGRQFLKLGADAVYAYHPHTYSYYHRDVSHPNMGYIYKGYGNGLENKITKCWPESDKEMIAASADEYITKDKPFHAYYMSVSGHLDYTFNGNAMSAKNKALVQNLNVSDTIKAYYACNIELDRAMELLLQKLEAAGVADKTVIAIAPDHYPYGLEDKENDDKYHYFSEILGHPVETNFELYKSALLLYSPGMKAPVSVDKYCSSLDINPTLSNLFNMEYDSRLLMGRDILSDTSPLVVFANRSFITDKGTYNSVTKTFTPFAGVTIANEEAYVSNYKKEVNNMFQVSAGILDFDYYGRLFGTKQTKNNN